MRKRAPAQEDSVTRVVRWAVMLFFAYILFSGGFHTSNSNPPPHPVAGASGGAVVAGTPGNASTDRECAPGNAYNSFSLIATSLIPSLIPVIHSEDVTAGTGDGATCGQHASLHYQYALPSGSVIFDNTKSDPTQVIIGDGGMLRGLEMGLIGMKPGGVRRITFPAALGFARLKDYSIVRDLDKYALKPADLHDSILTGTVSLVSLTPGAPASEQPMRIIERKFNSGTRTACGDTVRLNLIVWKLDGTKIYSSYDEGKPVVFTLGASEAPYGIEQAALGMGEDGERTAIIPAAYTKPLRTDTSWPMQPRLLATHWPNETLLAEVHLEHVGPEMPSFVPGMAVTPALPSSEAPPAPVTPPVNAPHAEHPKAKQPDKNDDDDDDDDKPEKPGTGSKPQT